MYDIVFIGKDEESFVKLKERFPTAKKVIIEDDILSAFNEAKRRVFTRMFWVVWDDIEISPDFKFDYIVKSWDEKYNHLFLNGEFYDGVGLFAKTAELSNRELSYRFFANKKEVNILASTPKPFDVVFISYFEKTAEANFQDLIKHLQPNQKLYRVNGVKGIHQAHQCAAELVSSDMFWVIDADADISDNFSFNYQIAKFDSNAKRTVYVWRSINPINDLEYGYGGVKLFPTALTLNMDMSKPDMTTSISLSFKAVEEVSNISKFNTDPFTTWRSAFRECVKLASKTIQGQQDLETEERLDIWCTVGADREFGEYAISGAKAGRKYGQDNAGNIPALSLINDYDWLKSQFEQTH